jgi:iron(III) transport system substrate-binding protein
MRIGLRGGVAIGATVALALVSLTACGSTASSASSKPADYGSSMGLSDADLIKAAQSEGSVTVYTGQNAAKIDPLVKAFEAKYHISVKLYHADSEEVLQRVLQETGANKAANDVLDLDGAQMMQAQSEKILTPDTRPSVQTVPADLRYSDWYASHLLVYEPTWNTNLVKGSDIPKKWTDLADPKWKGKIGLEATDSVWYYALMQSLQKDDGMTEAQAQDTLLKIAENGLVNKGHTTMTQLLGSGEYSIFASPYINSPRELAKNGGPVAYTPGVVPGFVVPSGPGLMTNAAHPAAALLWIDFDLGKDGQTLLRDKGDVDPAVPAYQTGDFHQMTLEVVDLEGYLKDSKKWDDTYSALLTHAQKG